MMTIGRDVYYFRCLEHLKNSGIVTLDCITKPEGVLITLGNQYEIFVLEGWVNGDGEYLTKLLFTVENDRDRFIEVIDGIVKRISDMGKMQEVEYSEIEADSEKIEMLSFNPLAPIIVGETLLNQILD